MKTRTKVSGQYQRRYASGILMYRERMNLVEVPANATVHILKVESKRTLCTYKDDRVYIPNENLPKRKAEQPTPKAKRIKAKKAELPAVQAEVPAPAPAAETPAPAPVETPVITAEVPAEATAEPVTA